MSASVATGATLSRCFFGSRAGAVPQSPTKIRKFAVGLPGIGPSGANEIGQYLPLATKQSMSFAGQAADFYDLVATPFSQHMHPDLPGKTRFFGYADALTLDQKYLGGLIVSKRGTPTILNVRNLIPPKHILPVDPTAMAGMNPDGTMQMVGDLPLNRIALHLHGGFTPWFSDGTPFQWYTPTGLRGPSFLNVPGFITQTGAGSYYFPNDQSARLAWYHDHAIGLTRLNAYAGLASAYIITDDFEANLVSQGLLPDLIGIPLVIQDKGFVPPNVMKQDPTWKWGNPGDLWYPHRYNVNIFEDGTPNPEGTSDWGPTSDPPSFGTKSLPPLSLVPEAFFDTILINGGLYPVTTVPPRRVRFRLLNGSQARFYHLNLYAEDRSIPGEANPNIPGSRIYQIGTEAGFLPAIAVHDNNTPIPLDVDEDPSGSSAKPDGPFNLLLAPAERADVIIDFNGLPAGASFILYNDAPAPFPSGDSRNDYFTGDADQRAIGGAMSTEIGHGPNTRTLMKIVVGPGNGDSIGTSSWSEQMNVQLKTNYLSGNQSGLLYHNGDPSVPAFPFNGVVDRTVTLNEDFDEYGRLIQTIGTDNQFSYNNQGLPTWGRPYMSDPTETPNAGATEVWQIMNLTMDTHPIHFHLVNVQLIQRQAFEGVPGDWRFVAPPMPPDPNEIGWKETVRVNPGEIATVIMKFDLPHLPTSAMRDAVSPRTGGREYVWHCHILEHEEHDMMRPLIVR
jgi:spore coat protein A